MTTTATTTDNFVNISEAHAKAEKPRIVVKTWHALVVGIVLGCAYNFYAAYTAHNMVEQGMCTATSASTDIL